MIVLFIHLITLLLYLFEGFQRKVLYLLTDIRNSIKEMGQTMAPANTPVHVSQMESMDKFGELEDQLKEPGKKQFLVSDDNIISVDSLKFPF